MTNAMSGGDIARLCQALGFHGLPSIAVLMDLAEKLSEAGQTLRSDLHLELAAAIEAKRYDLAGAGR